MRFKKSLPPYAVEMDLAPMIDIVFQQLIFFMLTSAFVFQSGVKIHLPKAVTAEITHRENLVITVSEGDHLYLGERLLTLQELPSQLKALKGPSLLIRADREASLGRVVEVWDLCRAIGISEVNIATTSEKPNVAKGRGSLFK